MNREELEGSRKLFFTLLWVDIVATAIIGLNAFSTVGTLQDIHSGRTTVDQSLMSSFDFWDNLAKLTILTMIGVGIGLVKWLNACYSCAKNSIGASGLANEGWTTWGWLIPFFNLFKPYQVIAEIYKVGSPSYAGSEDWKRESGSGALLAWWIFWAITHFIMWMMFKTIMSSNFGENATMRGAIMATQLQAWTCVVSLAIAGMWFWVANLLTQRLLDRNAISANSPPLQYAYQTPASATRSAQPAPAPVTMPATSAPTRIIMSSNPAPTQPIDAQSPSPFDEDAVYEVVANEMDSGKMDKGLWTRLFAELDGDEKKVKIAYIKQRAEKLMAAERARVYELQRQQAEELARQDRNKEIEEEEKKRIEKLTVKARILERLERGESGPLSVDGFLDAVRRGDINGVSQLLDKEEMYAAARDSSTGNTALHIAVAEKNDAMIRLLIQAGAPVSVKNSYGLTPTDFAKEHPKLIAIFREEGVISL